MRRCAILFISLFLAQIAHSSDGFDPADLSDHWLTKATLATSKLPGPFEIIFTDGFDFSLGSGIIFEDYFESGDLSRWGSTVPKSDLSVIAEAARVPSRFGMAAQWDDDGVQTFVATASPNNETVFQANISFAANTLAPAAGGKVVVLRALSGEAIAWQLSLIEGSQLLLEAMDNNSLTTIATTTIDGQHLDVGVGWTADNLFGTSTLTLDAQEIAVGQISNGNLAITSVRMGLVAISGEVPAGAAWFDDVVFARILN